MMEIKIQTDKGEKEITCNSPKGKHTKEGFRLFTALMGDEKGNPKLLNEYTEFLDKLTSELTGMKIEELDNLDSDEKNKLVSFYQNKIVKKVDFIKSSLKSDNLEQKEKKE